MSRRAALVGFALVFLCAARASAECQAPGTICAEYDAAGVVFLARVTQVMPDADDRQVGPLRPQTVTFDVIEDFKGTAGSAATLIFDPTAADARLFSTGETVLVYARRTAERSWWFAGCSRTRRVDPEDSELLALRQLQGRLPGASLEGNLQIPAGDHPPVASRQMDLSGLALSVQALDGSGTINVSSQTNGYFLVPWLKPGNYRIRLESPVFVSLVRDVAIGDRTRCQTLGPFPLRPR